MLDTRESEVAELKQNNDEKVAEVDKLHEEINALKLQVNELSKCSSQKSESKYSETELLKAEIRELREELSDMSLNEYGGIEPGRTQRTQNIIEEDSAEDIEVQKLNIDNNQRNHYCQELEKLRQDFEIKKRDFEEERSIWAQEKEKVLKYQRQLQMNYVQMFRRNRTLEAEVENLTIELELDKTGMKKKLSSADFSHTIEL